MKHVAVFASGGGSNFQGLLDRQASGDLPARIGKGMFGSHVHRAVIESGAKITGVTVHLVNEEYDDGPIVVQEPVRVIDTDTAESLAERVLAVEHATYWRAVKALASDALRVDGRRVFGDV